MIYTSIISLLIEKPFYLWRPQSFSFQVVSEFIDIFVKFSDFMSRGGVFNSLFCLEGRVFVHNDGPGRRVLPLWIMFQGFVPGRGDGLDETDSCIKGYMDLPKS